MTFQHSTTFQHDAPLRAPMMRRLVVRSHLGGGRYLVTDGSGFTNVAVARSAGFRRGDRTLGLWSQSGGVWIIQKVVEPQVRRSFTGSNYPHTRLVVNVSADVSYVFGITSDGISFAYWKSTDGGETVGAPVVLDDSSSSTRHWDIQYEGGLTGGRANIIHIVRAHITSFERGAYYRQLDTDTDTLSTELKVTSGSGFGSPTPVVSVAVSPDLSLINVQWMSSLSAQGWSSTDDGATWASSVAMMNNTAQTCTLWPDYNSSDPRDLIAIRFNQSGSYPIIRTLLDISLNNKTDTTITNTSGEMLSNDLGTVRPLQISTCLDPATGTIYLAHWDTHADTTNTLKVWAITRSAITALTTPVSGVTYGRGVAISFANGTLHLFYARDPAGASQSAKLVYHIESADLGLTWSAETVYDDVPTATHWIGVDPIPSVVLQPVWANLTTMYRMTPAIAA